MNKKGIYVLIVLVLVIIGIFAIGSRTNDQQVEKVTMVTGTASSSVIVVPSENATSTKEQMPMRRNIFVTQKDNGKTVTLYKGEAFLLNLGEMDWTLSISNPNIISRVKNIMVIRGAQGIYRTDHVGTTTIAAQGRPHCDTGKMCAQYIVNFSTTIVVK